MLLAQYYPFKYEIVPFYILLRMERENEEIQHLSGGLCEISACIRMFIHMLKLIHTFLFFDLLIYVQENVRERKLELICVLL